MSASVLKGDFLCMAIDQPTLKVRLLGYSKDIEIEPHVIVFATGNNLRSAATSSAAPSCATSTPASRTPGERKFKINPVAMIRRDRGKYVAAVLTLCRAFLLSGADRCEPPLAGFEEWSDLVRSALVWLGMRDPVKTTEALRENDPERDELAQVVENWQVVFAFGHEVMVPEIITRANRLLSSDQRLGRPRFPRPHFWPSRGSAMATGSMRHGSATGFAPIRTRSSDGCVFRRGDRTKNGYLWRLDRGVKLCSCAPFFIPTRKSVRGRDE